MKFILTLLATTTFSFTSLASANCANVGDFAQYKLTKGDAVFNSKVEISEMEEELGIQFYLVTTTNTLLEETQTDESIATCEDLSTIAELKDLLAVCESEVNGKLETVTVPAGTFETCKLEQNGVSLYIGVVTFGVVKMTSEEEGLLELVNFKQSI